MFRAVIFDFDGTLVDSNAIKERCLHTTVANAEGGVEALYEARKLGGDRYRLFAEVARQLDRTGDMACVARHGLDLAEAYGRCCARMIVVAPERRGARRALAALKRRGLHLYVNSSTPRRDLIGLLRARGISRYFDGAVGSPISKTDNLRKLLQTLRVAPRAAVVVGDGEDDLAAASAIGTWFVGITAERRIADRLRFGLRDLTLLVPLLDRMAPRRLDSEKKRA